MDRRRAAGALLALAACFASLAAAPTASNHTALDLYDEPTEGCYYNFQHYGEGDRIMTNEPCLNCTCHNRMLMCYLRVCPFTKAIGQDCTVEKRADQCCPIVTCPDVPVDLLTSTSTSSPAEYGGTGVGKVDKYGCSINGKYFPEGAKVPPTPGKPCEHCYCIRNMTTCVMQECTLHVDGCTPIYHKDVCCPVRYFCDHPEDEIPLLDDMTTTVRPTPGFLLTTTAPTEAPATMTQPARRDCIEDDQLYPDGALIKTDKPCEHCYCMKGDIVCVVQECGTPMENEGKNCTSLPPREGQCCPDTYICEGDELSTEIPSEEPITTIVPPRRVSVEGSGYRNEPDEMIPYTDVPTFATELEGSGEEELPQKPIKEDRLEPTEEAEFIPLTTQVPTSQEIDKATTEPDKGLNTVPSGMLDKESTEPSLQEKTTLADSLTSTDSTHYGETATTPKAIFEEEKPSKPSLVQETTPVYQTKTTESSTEEQYTTVSDDVSKKVTHEISMKDTTPQEEEKATESSIVSKPEAQSTVKSEREPITQIPITEKPEAQATVKLEEEPFTDITITELPETHTVKSEKEETITESSIAQEPDQHSTVKTEEEPITNISVAEPSSTDDLPSVSGHDITTTEKVQEPFETSVAPMVPSDQAKTTVSPTSDESEELPATDARRTTPDFDSGTSPKSVEEEEKTEAPVSEHTTLHYIVEVTEPAVSDQNIIPISGGEEQSTEAEIPEKTTERDEPKVPEILITTEQEAKPIHEESSESSVFEGTTRRSDIDASEVPVEPEDKLSHESTTVISKEEESFITTEPTFRKEDEVTPAVESVTDKELVPSTMSAEDIAEETDEPSVKATSTEKTSPSEPEEPEIKPTMAQLPEQQEQEKTSEATTEIIMELSTFAHVSDKESATTLVPESEAAATVAASTEKIELPETTTINLADNEIAEVPSPGRIPGEGDCLLEGTTYKNDSIVPSTNKCHSGCKCVSSIIKCNPIICSAPPEDMDNCQPRYDTPEACCPTYVCDHGMETIPPQPQSHITGTEGPTPSTIECHGEECEKTEEKLPSAEPSQTPVKEEMGACGGSDCDQAVQTPTELCSNGKCEVLQPTEIEQPQEISQSCTSPEDCKAIKAPAPCEGESCTASQGELCDKEGGCVVKEPETIPHQETPQACASEEECKQVKVTQPESAPCKGESCKNVQEDCSTGECVSQPLQPSPEAEICSEKSGCKKTEESAGCENGKCESTEFIDRTGDECSGDSCMQPQPVPPTQETAYTEQVSTEPAAINEVTSRPEEEIQQVSTELPLTLIEEAVTVSPTLSGEPDKEIEKPESPVSDEEDRVTSIPDETVTTHLPAVISEQPASEDTEQKVTEISPAEGMITGGSATESPLDHTSTAIKEYETESPETYGTELEVKPTEEKIEHPEEVTEFNDIRTDKPKETIATETEKSTEGPEQQYDETKPTELPEPLTTEESTKPLKEVEKEQEHITVSPVTTPADTEVETGKPEQVTEETLAESPVPEIITDKLYEETTKLPEPVEESSESGMKATEPSILEPQKTVEPEITTAFNEMEILTESPTESPAQHDEDTVTEILTESPTKSPAQHDEDIVTEILTESPTESPAQHDEDTVTSTYEKETVSSEHIQTELPFVHVTEPQEDITEIPKEDTEKLSTSLPKHPDDEDHLETTTQDSDVTKTVSVTETKLSEEDVKEATTEIPAHSTISVPSEHTPAEQEEVFKPHITESQTTLSTEKEENVTPSSQDDTEKTTRTSEPTIVEEEKETESPLSPVTKQPLDDMTTISLITERDEIPELPFSEPQLHEAEDEMRTQAPEAHQPKETASPFDAEKTESPKQPITEQESYTEKLSTVKPDQESLSTEQQELEPESPVSVTTEISEPAVSEEQEQPITTVPIITETEASVVEHVTDTSHEIKTPEVHEKTTSMPMQSSTSEKEVENGTERHETAITEEYELITGEPEILDEDEHHTVTYEVTSMKPHDLVTEIPETLEETDKDKVTEKPASDLEENVTEFPGATAHSPELPSPVTESQKIPEHVAEEKGSTESPISEHESSEIPEEISTKQTFTESTEIHETVEQEEQLSTTSPSPADIEPHKLSTIQSSEDDLQTKLPEPSLEQATEKEEAPVTFVPKIPVDEEHTKLPEVQETTAELELSSPEISEVTTLLPQTQEEVHDKKQTEEPVTESQETTTAKVHKEVPEQDTTEQEEEVDVHKKDQVPTDSSQEAEVTITPVEASTIIPISEEDKQQITEEPVQTSRPKVEYSETTPYLVELQEHTHKMDEVEPTVIPSDEPTVTSTEEPTIASSEEPTVFVSEISTVAPSAEPHAAPSEEPTVASPEKSTVSPLAEPTVASSEESTVAPSEGSTIPLSEEPTVASSEEPAIVASEAPITTPSEGPTVTLSEEPTTVKIEMNETEPHIIEPTTEKLPIEEKHTEIPETETERPSDKKEEAPLATEEPQSTASLEEEPEKPTESAPTEETSVESVTPTGMIHDKFGSPEEDDIEKEAKLTTPKQISEEDVITPLPALETEKPISVEEPEKDITIKPQYVPVETTAPEEEFIPVTTKTTTIKVEEEVTPTQPPPIKADEKPSELPASTTAPEVSKPELQPTDEVPSPEDESHFPPSGGYNQEPDYVEEDQAFGPGTCRYGGKVYVSAQQIPRDDPCDFCFCFRSDIICLQQSCPPPIHGCHEEPIQGFCCPRYECPVSMATTLNVTTTTTTTTTTLPPHFLPHAYKGAATRKGCQIKGHTYQVGEIVRASSGPCLHCTCGGDGQMKCDPKQCTPEPMLRQMIAAAVSAKRRR